MERECGLITSGTDKGSNWLLREKNMDEFCKTVLRAAWKHPKPPGTTYKVRIEILKGGDDPAPEPPIKDEMKQEKLPYAD